jgi:2-dehydropantoate 2-reductase
MMKILIMGTGAVGGFYGAKLASNKSNDVTFAARGESLKKIKKEGLIVKAVEGDLSIKNPQVTDKPRGEYDLILFTVKNYDLETAANVIKNTIDQNTVILPLQNGVDAYKKLSKNFGKEKVLVGVTYIITTKTGPNTIEQIGGPRQIVFGEQDGTISKRIKEIQNNFKESKINSEYSDNSLGVLWGKFIFICAFAGITAITRSSIGPIRDYPFTRQMYIDLLKEGINVAKKLKIKLSDNYLKNMIQKVDSKEMPDDSKSSLLVDIENNQWTELDYLNGAMVRIAEENRRKAHLNEFIYHCLKVKKMEG